MTEEARPAMTLLPCPFCGEQPETQLDAPLAARHAGPAGPQETIVWCKHCGANTWADNWQCRAPRFTTAEREALEIVLENAPIPVDDPPRTIYGKAHALVAALLSQEPRT